MDVMKKAMKDAKRKSSSGLANASANKLTASLTTGINVTRPQTGVSTVINTQKNSFMSTQKSIKLNSYDRNKSVHKKDAQSRSKER